MRSFDPEKLQLDVERFSNSIGLYRKPGGFSLSDIQMKKKCHTIIVVVFSLTILESSNAFSYFNYKRLASLSLSATILYLRLVLSDWVKSQKLGYF